MFFLKPLSVILLLAVRFTDGETASRAPAPEEFANAKNVTVAGDAGAVFDLAPKLADTFNSKEINRRENAPVREILNRKAPEPGGASRWKPQGNRAELP